MSAINCLPPAQKAPSNYGYLKVTPISITSFKNSIDNPIVRLQFWGSTNPVYISICSSQAYTIITPLLKFKQYLVDCKATPISIVDNRNYKCTASTFLHWLAYLRPLQDKQVYTNSSKDQPNSYFLPFYDEVIQATLPLYAPNNHKRRPNQKIGELTLKWQCRVWTQDIALTNKSKNLPSASNLSNLRLTNPNNIDAQNMNPMSICKIDLQVDQISGLLHHQDLKTNKTIKQNIKNSNNRLINTDHPLISKSNNHANFRDPIVLQQRQSAQIAPISSKNRLRNKDTPSQTQMQVQLLRLRLDVQQLIKIDKKQQNVIVYILYFQSLNRLLPSKEISAIDVECRNSSTTTHTRIFAQTCEQEKNYFHSSMIAQNSSTLEFSATFRKDKKVMSLQGSIKIKYIADTADVNMLSPQGIIMGYLRVQAERTQRLEQRQNKLPIIDQTVAIKKHQKRPKQMQPTKSVLKKQPYAQKQASFQQPTKQIKQQKSPSFQSSESSFFLVLIKQTKKYDDFDYNVLKTNISHLNFYKFAFVSQQQMINKPFQLLIFQKQQLVYHQKIIDQLQFIPPFKQSLTCCLVYEHTVPNLDLICQLYAGNLQQINRLLQEYTQSHPTHAITQSQKPSRQNTERALQNHPKQAKIINDPLRKLKTQGIMGVEDNIRRMTQQKNSGQNESVVAMDKLSMNEGVQSQNHPILQQENIYLVDILTRFLDSLTPAIFPSVQSIKKTQFIQIISKNSNEKSAIQLELIQIISSIFQNESNTDNVNLNLVNQCHKAYQTFLNMYIKQKQELIQQILAVQPKAISRIKANAEMETINQSILWGRALQKVKHKITKQKINKFYKISSFSTTDCHLLLEDLENKKQHTLRSLDIGNLGMIVKEWVQQFIRQLSLQSILPIKQHLLSFGEEDNWLNIKNISETFEEWAGLRLSMWQSLMLIEEIKGAYSCDLQLEQGVISSNSLLSWINGIYNRNDKDSSSQSSSPSLDAQQLALIKKINKSQVEKQPKIQDRSQVSSMVIPNNNYSDVVDIANLLRQKDGFSPLLVPQDANNPNRAVFNKKQTQIQNLAVRVPTELSDRVEKQQPNEIRHKNTHQYLQVEKKRLQAEKWKQFYVQIRQLKLYEFKSKSKLLKITIKFSSEQYKNIPFYYLSQQKNYSEANNQTIKFVVDMQNLIFKQSGLHILIQNEEQRVVVNGLLPVEDISEWIKSGEEEVRKTIVLYEAVGRICGKLTLKILKNWEQSDKLTMNSNQENLVFLTIKDMTPTLKATNLYISAEQNTKYSTKLNQKISIKLLKPIYQSEINISDQNGQLSCTISLEELFLKRFIQAEFPLINTHTAQFVSTLNITMSYLHHNQSNLQTDTITEKPKQQQKTQNGCLTYMINQINVMGYNFNCNFTAKLYCYIHDPRKQSSKDQLILVSSPISFNVQRYPKRYYISQQKIQTSLYDQQSYVQFKLVNDGAVVASTQSIKMGSIRSAITTTHLSMRGHGKVLFCLGIKKLKIPNIKYSLRRVYECLNTLPEPLSQKHLPSFMKTLKQQFNLTVCQIQMMKEIVQSNHQVQASNILAMAEQVCYAVNCCSLIELFPVSARTLASILNQLIFLQIELKNTISGVLQRSQIIRILQGLKEDSDRTDLINKLQGIFEQMALYSKNSETELPYAWILMLLQKKDTVGISQKNKIIKQIDGIYQSMLHRYA